MAAFLITDQWQNWRYDAEGRQTAGRPLGAAPFLERIEALLKRSVTPRKPGRKRKDAQADIE